MSKTIKIIELLNKIANGEEVPKKIKYKNDILKYDEEVQDYMGCSKTGSGSFFNYLFVNHATSDFINDTVEIIEEEPEIDIQSMQEVTSFGIKQNQNAINELIKAVKQLDNKWKK